MTDLARMSPEDYAALGDQMRMANTGRLKQILDGLEPYCDGSLGPVSLAHVNAYVKTVRELGLMWHAYDRPSGGVEEKSVEVVQMELEARQAAVLAELGKLREVGMRRKVS